MKKTLYELSAEMQTLEDALYENGGELTPELESQLAETQESMIAKVDGYNAIIRKFSATSDAVATEIKRLQSLKKTADNAEKRLKEHILAIMEMYGIERLEGQFCKMYPRKSEKVEVDESTLIAPYIRLVEDLKSQLPEFIQVDIKVNKTILKQSIKESGITPAGVETFKNITLTIK